MANKPVPMTLMLDGNVLWGDDKEWKDGTPYRHDLAPGTASWIANSYGNENAALDFVCPCGCGAVGAISVNLNEKKDRAWTWNWNGDVEKPTLLPSIQKTTPCRWHGYLTDGVFVPC